MIISLILIPVQMFGISIINTFGEDASTGTCLVPDCSSLRLDNGTLIEIVPLALGTCFDFTGDGICEVTRISNNTVILEGDFTPGWPVSEVVYDEGPAVEEEEEAVAEEEDDNDDDNNGNNNKDDDNKGYDDEDRPETTEEFREAQEDKGVGCQPEDDFCDYDQHCEWTSIDCVDDTKFDEDDYDG